MSTLSRDESLRSTVCLLAKLALDRPPISCDDFKLAITGNAPSMDFCKFHNYGST